MLMNMIKVNPKYASSGNWKTSFIWNVDDLQGLNINKMWLFMGIILKPSIGTKSFDGLETFTQFYWKKLKCDECGE